MKAGVVAVVAACAVMVAWTTGCADGRPPAGDTVAVEDAAPVAEVPQVRDTMSQLISETAMPNAADELFDDFIFNFAANPRLQMERVAFPLRVTDGESESTVDESQWRMDCFFMEQGYYTLIFDDREKMEAVKDTSVNNVVVEKILLGNSCVRRYDFHRIAGRWMLTTIDDNAPYDACNASFLTFYRHFASDMDFQVKSLNDPITFTGPDPDDDFSMMTGEIAPESWPAFAPDLPDDVLFNIVYGQEYADCDQKVFLIRGIANGLEMELLFRRVGGEWKLSAFRE